MLRTVISCERRRSTRRTHSTTEHHCRGTIFFSAKTRRRWELHGPPGKRSQPRTFTENRFRDDREIPQVICATLWIHPHSPPSILLSAQLCFLIIVRPMKSINYPSLQSYWKGSEKKQREMRAANPFFIPLVALNKRRMCCLSVTEGIKSSGLSHAFSAPCRASLRETEWRRLQQHPARTLHIIW